MGNSKIFNLLESDDVKHTLQSLKDLGVKILRKKSFYEVYGEGGLFKKPKKIIFKQFRNGVRLLTGLLASKD